MLRFLYNAVLRAHPPYFRQRFSEEMQAIFDQADTELAKARLLADAVFSLVRQWTLRPQFWEEPAPVAAEGSRHSFRRWPVRSREPWLSSPARSSRLWF